VVDGVARFATRDMFGSVTDVTNVSADLLGSYSHHPWGSQTLAGADESSEAFTRHRRVPGIGGVVLAPFRAHSVALGRWLSEDPIGLGWMESIRLRSVKSHKRVRSRRTHEVDVPRHRERKQRAGRSGMAVTIFSKTR
jgi:hypothetical protein